MIMLSIFCHLTARLLQSKSKSNSLLSQVLRCGKSDKFCRFFFYALGKIFVLIMCDNVLPFCLPPWEC